MNSGYCPAALMPLILPVSVVDCQNEERVFSLYYFEEALGFIGDTSLLYVEVGFQSVFPAIVLV